MVACALTAFNALAGHRRFDHSSLPTGLRWRPRGGATGTGSYGTMTRGGLTELYAEIGLVVDPASVNSNTSTPVFEATCLLRQLSAGAIAVAVNCDEIDTTHSVVVINDGRGGGLVLDAIRGMVPLSEYPVAGFRRLGSFVILASQYTATHDGQLQCGTACRLE
jgi:hypothetical protein